MSINTDAEVPTKKKSTPIFLKEANEVAKGMSQLSEEKLQDILKISPSLAELNYQRYQDWNYSDSSENKKQAIYLFTGDVYDGIDAQSMNADTLGYAQKNLKILSGMYGIIRPLDMIQPYRLDMHTKWSPSKNSKNLYDFWSSKITAEINKEIKNNKSQILINIASNEYLKAIIKKEFDYPIINITFKENKDGKYKVMAFYAKKARGLFARYMADNKIEKIDELKMFTAAHYAYDDHLSSEKELVFTR